MPDINGTPYLEKLDLSWCKNLECAHESIAYHGNLQFLNLSRCSKLHHFPNVLRSKNLQFLDLNFCTKLQRFPDIPDKIGGLRELYLEDTSIEELSASIENLVSLEIMDLTNCKKLAILPSSIYKLNNLGGLYLSGCSKLTKFPKKEEDLCGPHMKTGFSKLRILSLDGCNLSEVEFLQNPSCFPKLSSLDVSYCQELKEIHNIPLQLIRLSAKDCKSLSKIPSNIPHAQYVYLNSCHELLSGLTMNDLFNPQHFNPEEHYNYTGSCEFLLPGGEMPQWLLPNENGYISFTASKDLFKKIVALVICVVVCKDERIEGFELWLYALVNGKMRTGFMTSVTSSLLDHVCLRVYEVPQLWGGLEYAFGADDRSQFHIMIKAESVGTIVKKCGFRLLCKPLENDLKILLEDDQLMDPDIIYEIQNDGYQSIKNEGYRLTMSLQEWMDEFTVEKWRYSLIHPYLRIVRPGGEMPKDFVLAKDSTISFMASQEFFDKFRGLALCVVFGVEDGEKEISFDIVPHVHGQRGNVLSGTLGSFDSDHVWIQYLRSNVLWGVLEGGVDFGQFNESYLQFSIKLRVSGGTVKRLGYMLRCTPLEKDLKVMLEDNQLVDPAVLYEDGDGCPRRIAANFMRRFRERETGSQ
ncbi:putative disease resistance protein At4g11170 [Eucalyptus grandis]|uniref:putative disease resistance protein At4g11170 n=1 Tax=Eucalyptus grandis TaxID=71139 RepID=UPI00192EEEB7|nr:putative disease resistance protein At4g11170 [Eucalyptus grandis]